MQTLLGLHFFYFYAEYYYICFRPFPCISILLKFVKGKNMDAKANKNKMGVLPIGKLIADVSVPLMVSMLVQSLYNVIDSIFVAKISESAVTATGLAYSAQMLMLAVAVGTGVGVNSLLSRSLGKGDREFANKTATTGLLLALFWTVIFMIIGGLFSGKFIAFFTDDTQIIDYGTSYLTICTLGCVGIFLATTGERLLQATGNTMLSMLAQLSGAVMNIILDPILIFDFGAGLGVKGAALATVIGQITAAAVSLIFNQFNNKEIHFVFKGFKPEMKIIAQIYKVGIPTFVMQTMSSVMMIFMNKILFLESSTAVAFYGIYYKLYTFVYMPVSGLAQGLIPIVGYNYGAGLYSRVKKAFSVTLVTSIGIMLVGAVLYFALPNQLLSLYSASSEMLSFGVKALRILALTFPFAAVTITSGFACSGMGNGVVSMVGTLLRQLLILIPVAYLFYMCFGFAYVWYASWISEIIAAVYAVFAVKRQFKKLKND